MAPEHNAAQDQAARPAQQTINAPAFGLLLIGRLRELTSREYQDRDGKNIEAVDAFVLAGNGTYRVELGTQLQSKELTGHVAPWKCDEESIGERIALPIAVRVATSRNGPFLSYRAQPA